VNAAKLDRIERGTVTLARYSVNARRELMETRRVGDAHWPSKE
jgi:hypothetical protein